MMEFFQLLIGNTLLNRELRSKLIRMFGVKQQNSALVIPQEKHGLLYKKISQNAVNVLYRLKKLNYAGYLVGGSVRDLLLNRTPKDFDVVTDGRPEVLRQRFRNSRIIGRRFRLLHVFFPGEIVEVSTFRTNTQYENKNLTEDNDDVPIAIVEDNTYGTIEEDAWRRDFTVNALYYNIADFSIVDYTGGMIDLKHQVIRMIGDPMQRYHEDPVRLLRAIRLAAKLRFNIHPKTEAPLKPLSGLLQHVPEPRLFDELLKLFFEGNAVVSYEYLEKYDYVGVLFPMLPSILKDNNASHHRRLIELAMRATDKRFANKRSLNPGFLLSVMLWPRVIHQFDNTQKEHSHFYQALHYAIDSVISEQNEMVRIPRRLIAMLRTVWVMQYQLIRRRRKRVYRTLKHRYFRAAFDFLVLRVEAGEPFQEEIDWWQSFQTGNPTQQDDMVRGLSKRKRK